MDLKHPRNKYETRNNRLRTQRSLSSLDILGRDRLTLLSPVRSFFACFLSFMWFFASAFCRSPSLSLHWFPHQLLSLALPSSFLSSLFPPSWFQRVTGLKIWQMCLEIPSAINPLHAAHRSTEGAGSVGRGKDSPFPLNPSYQVAP